MNNPFFDKIKQKTGVEINDLLKMANTLQNANFQDQQTVRNIVRDVARMANRPILPETEDRIVQAIVSGNIPKDFNSLTNMLKKY